MTTQFRRNAFNDIIAHIDEGMVVYDSHNVRVGIVEFIKLSADDSAAQAADMYPYLSFVNGIFGDADDIPDALRSRLAREGYLRIDGGFLAADRIALLDQIATVDENAVTLSVRFDDLIIL